MTKWEKLSELNELLADGYHIPVGDERFKTLKCICYAPNIGYRCWIFKYKGILVALDDLGNGWYGLYSAVTNIDVLGVKLYGLKERILSWLKRL